MNLYLAPHPTTELKNIAERGYECLLCSLGYESRSRALAEHISFGPSPAAIHAAGFLHGHGEAYVDNRQVLQNLDAEIFETNDEDFRAWAMGWFNTTPHRRVAIDISSMSRPRIAALVEAIQAAGNENLVADFLYVPQAYKGPALPLEVPAALGPVSAAFAGWETDVERPLVILFGLGYEPLRAAAAIDALEPALAVPFFPHGSNPAFVNDVEVANADVLRLDNQGVTKPRDYRIEDPFTCFAQIDALISKYVEREEARPLLLPLGPKIFALVCLLASAVRNPPVPVWRASPGLLDKPVDQEPEDTLVTLQVSAAPIELRQHGG
jgi:hypothetical protein